MSPARIVVAGIVVASAVSVVSLLFGVRERRRQGDGWVRAVILVVTHAIAGVCLITPGFVLEPALWALFNDGVIGMWEVLGSSTTGFSALKSFTMWSLLPGVIAGVAAVSARAVGDRIARAVVAAVLLLAIEDTVQRLLSLPASASVTKEQFLFSLLSDALGGGIAGATLGWLSSVLIGTLDAEAPRATGFGHGVALWVTFLTIPAGLFLLYFCFFYHLPIPVIVDLRAWNRLSFDYVGPISMGPLKPMIPINALGAGSGFFNESVELDWRPADGESGSGRLSFRAMLPTWQDKIPKEGFIPFNALIDSSRPTQTVTLGTGPIRVVGEDLFVTVQSDAAQPAQGVLTLQNLLGLRLSRDERDQLEVILPGMGVSGKIIAPGVIPGVPRQLIITGLRGSKVSFQDQRRVGVIIARSPLFRVGSNVSDEKLKVVIPDGSIYEFSGAGVPKTHSFAVMMLIEDSRGGTLTLPLRDQLVCGECDLLLRAFGFVTPTVGQLRIDGAKGNIEVALTGYAMTEESELYLGGRRLTVTQEERSTLKITGRASPVVLNSVVLSQTVWSSSPGEVRAAIIIAFGTLTLPLLRRLWLSLAASLRPDARRRK